MNQLQRRLSAATTQLGRYRSEENNASFGSNTPALLSNNLFSVGGSSNAPYSGVVSLAMQYLGIPYKWGGASPTTGFDCSGLVQYVFAQVGISLPHYTVSQWNYPGAVPVAKNQLQPGDLVFFNGLDHVGIYIGFGDIIDAPHTGANVEIDSLERALVRVQVRRRETDRGRSGRRPIADGNRDRVHVRQQHVVHLRRCLLHPLGGHGACSILPIQQSCPGAFSRSPA